MAVELYRPFKNVLIIFLIIYLYLGKLLGKSLIESKNKYEKQTNCTECFRNYKNHNIKVYVKTKQLELKTDKQKPKPSPTHVLKICLFSKKLSLKYKSALQCFQLGSSWTDLFVSFLLLSLSPTPMNCLSRNPGELYKFFVSQK